MNKPRPGSKPYRPGLTFRCLTAAGLALGLASLAYGLRHHSSEAVILGRYSIRYACLLGGIAGGVGLLAWLLWRPTRRMVHSFYNIYILVAATTVAIAGAEIGLRLVNPWGIEFFHLLPYHMQGMVDDPQLGYVHPKSVTYQLGSNTVSLNANGLRDDEEVPYAKPPGERRILALGDSVTFGWGVDQGETFCERMEALLNSSGDGVTWEVINAGVNGYNSVQEEIFLRSEGMRYGPDVVILTYVVNDVDAIFDPNETTWRRYPDWPSSLPEMLDRLRSLSFLYQATLLFLQTRQADSAWRGEPRGSVTEHRGWPRSYEALTMIAAACRAAGIRFLVALEDGHDPAFVHQLGRADIDVVELESAWRQVPESRRHVSRVDPHPSAQVHRKIAEVLVAALRSRGWLEQ